MPWIKKDDCIGCGICVRECPADAIEINKKKAEIIDSKCIRCGVCHDVCPQSAVRHDSEKIPQQIDANINWVKNLLTNFKTEDERDAFIGRIKKHFNKEKVVIEKTLEKINSINK